ncbi:integrase core domain-containing protein [Burkholderia sp. PU8-34]
MAGRLTTRLQRPAAPRVDDARAKISAWRTHNNESRSHSALDWATPTEFARRYGLQAAGLRRGNELRRLHVRRPEPTGRMVV